MTGRRSEDQARNEADPPPPASGRLDYFPAVVCAFHDSAIDALVALCVRRDEATMLVTASWRNGDTAGCIVATLHGGRSVAALRTPDGRWAACNAFLDELFATPHEAGRRLTELLRRGRRGYVGHVVHPAASASPAGGQVGVQAGLADVALVAAPLAHAD